MAAPRRMVFPPTVLQRGSNPVQCSESRQADRKRVHCARYSRCLDHVAAKGWDGWSCERCTVLELLPHSEEHNDLHGLADLITEVMGPDGVFVREWRRFF